MMKKVRWGILSTAKIGVKKVIPAMQRGELSEVTAIASRSLQQAKIIARQLNIPTYYESYEKLLEDPHIDAVYIPLPNHLHVPWSVRALQSGKHVLCEKPIGISSKEARILIKEAEKHPHLKIMEAFMYRFHPQWQKAKQLVDEQAIGELKTIHSSFSYFNDDAANIRNVPEFGGGGLMDIGCYCISLSRFLFGAEPVSVSACMEFDTRFNTDRLASGILEFKGGTSTFTCSTQLFPSQRVHILGTGGRIEIDIPFNAPPDEVTHIWCETGSGRQKHEFEAVDQYTLQGDGFSAAILNDAPVPVPLADAEANMRVLEGLVESAKTGKHIRF
jgi:predicted dehydrogenase